MYTNIPGPPLAVGTSYHEVEFAIRRVIFKLLQKEYITRIYHDKSITGNMRQLYTKLMPPYSYVPTNAT